MENPQQAVDFVKRWKTIIPQNIDHNGECASVVAYAINLTSTNDKVRALFLAALMVLSVVAMTTAFAGSAAAAHDDTDRELQAGLTYWQGEQLNVTNSTGWVSGISEGDKYQIRTDDEANTLVRERTVGQDGHVTVSTSNLEGNYNLTFTEGTAAGSSATFEVVVQTFGTSFASSTVTAAGATDLEIDSNRGIVQRRSFGKWSRRGRP